MAPYVEVAFGTGFRPLEQIALAWDRVDLKRGKTEVREGWRQGQGTALKTAAANRDVDILPAVRKALERQRLIAGGTELVFPNRRGRHLSIGPEPCLVPHAQESGPQAEGSLQRAPHLRHPCARERRGSRLGREDARSHHPLYARDALLPIRPEPRSPRWVPPREATRAEVVGWPRFPSVWRQRSFSAGGSR